MPVALSFLYTLALYFAYYIVVKGGDNVEDDRKPKHTCDGCCNLNFEVIPANRFSMISVPFWAQATAEGELCGQGNEGHIQISAKGLVIFGVYTAFFITDKGPFPAGASGS